MIEIANDGAEIKSTNFWLSEHAMNGLVYISGNAGVLRLLLPEKSEYMLQEMKTGAYATIEPSVQDARCWDVVFEDGTDSPFAISVDKRQFDRAMSNGSTRLAVWTKNGKQMDLKCTVRIS